MAHPRSEPIEVPFQLERLILRAKERDLQSLDRLERAQQRGTEHVAEHGVGGQRIQRRDKAGGQTPRAQRRPLSAWLQGSRIDLHGIGER